MATWEQKDGPLSETMQTKEEFSDQTGEIQYESDPNTSLHRGLKSRHITMIGKP